MWLHEVDDEPFVRILLEDFPGRIDDVSWHDSPHLGVPSAQAVLDGVKRLLIDPRDVRIRGHIDDVAQISSSEVLLGELTAM